MYEIAGWVPVDDLAGVSTVLVRDIWSARSEDRVDACDYSRTADKSVRSARAVVADFLPCTVCR